MSDAGRAPTPPEPRRLSVGSAFATVLAIAYVAPRAIPDVRNDRSIFAAIGDRLLYGDVLYQEVWDNKDPLFYYYTALGRLAPPWTDIASEFLWFLLAGLATYAMARELGSSRPLAVVVGAALTPIVLAGPLYDPGVTNFVGNAMLVVITTLAYTRRWALAGVALGVLTLLKIVVTPIAVIVGLVALASSGRARSAFVSTTVAWAVTTGALLAFMAVRGELLPYLATFVTNFSYAGNDVLLAQGDLAFPAWASPLYHLAAVMVFQSWWTLLAIVLLLVAGSLLPVTAPRQCELWHLAAASLLGTGLVLALTGLWPRHGQMFYFPALMAIVALLPAATGIAQRAPIRLVVFALLAPVVVVGPIEPSTWAHAAASLRTRVPELSETSPQAHALLEIGPTGTYARVGSNEDIAHARGLSGWTLTCPVFHQYSFQSRAVLDPVLACLDRADVIILDASAHPVPNRPAWNEFVSSARTLVASGRACTQLSNGGDVCRKQ